jgi:hypothetical protein
MGHAPDQPSLVPLRVKIQSYKERLFPHRDLTGGGGVEEVGQLCPTVSSAFNGNRSQRGTKVYKKRPMKTSSFRTKNEYDSSPSRGTGMDVNGLTATHATHLTRNFLFHKIQKKLNMEERKTDMLKSNASTA